MSRGTDLANRLREVFLNGRWIANTNYKDQLQAVSLEQALKKPGGSNSVAALVFHVNYYLAGLLEAFDKGVLSIRDKYSYDLPPLNSEQDWEDMKRMFLENAELFAARIESFPDTLLDESFIDPRYGTYLRNIEGVIEHSYYHLGQMVLIRKWGSSF